MPAQKKYLFITLASLGNFFPAIKLAHILQEKGQQVLFANAVEYGVILDTNGIEHIDIKNQKSQSPFLFPGNWYSQDTIEEELLVLDQIVQRYRPDFIVTNPLVLVSFMLAERYAVPLINIGYVEYLYPGLNDDSPDKRWRIGEITKFYNNCRRKVGLPPIAVDPTGSPLIGSRYLLRSVPELHDHIQLPPQVVFAGGLYWEPPYTNILLDRFISARQKQQRPLVYLQMGRLFQNREIWTKLVDILSRQDCGFVVDYGRSDYISQDFQPPDNFFMAPFIPLGKIHREISFVICSGQSTVALAAVLHGKPILTIPHSSDAKELNQTLEEKGLGVGITNWEALNEANLRAQFKCLLEGKLIETVSRYQQLFQAYENKDAIFEQLSMES